MSIGNQLVEIATRLAPGAAQVLVDVAKEALGSGQNPELFLRRRLMANAAAEATAAAAREALKE